MNLINKAHSNNQKKEKVLKKSKTGMETEFHVLDSKGRVSMSAHELIAGIKSRHSYVDVVKEAGRNMIEFGCYPDVAAYNPSLNMIDSIMKANDVAEEMGLALYPFSTYPGKFVPELSEGKTYEIKRKILGDEKIRHACRVTGFHHHYSLPKGVFDANAKEIRLMKKSKLERSMVSSYNFEIAADPLLALFAQSSPFYQGRLLGKDARIIVYRGGKKLGNMEGVYARMQQIGGLPPYKQTATDLLESLKKRRARWRMEYKKAFPKGDFDKAYTNKMDIGWHPVKLNKHGTLEQRGMDINFMSTLIAITAILKYCLKKIQHEFLEVVPADFGIEEAFKLENGILYIPPHTYVRNRLQKLSAYNGYESKELQRIACRFLNFAKSNLPKRYVRIVRPILDMAESGKSMSDRIIQYAKYKGYLDNGKISNQDAAELALYYARLMNKDLEKSREELEKVAML